MPTDNNNIAIFNTKNHTNQTFNHLVLENESLAQMEFQNCRFKQCKFNEVHFNSIKFSDCEFESCDLSLSTLQGCRFSETSFKESKLLGINWTKLYWPLVKLSSPIYFYECNISHSSFFELELPSLIIENCKAHNVDFREADLNRASFVGTDLLGSLFTHTNLKQADFTNAMNYNLDIQLNSIEKAIFSFPEVIGLLHNLDIKIKGLPNEDV